MVPEGNAETFSPVGPWVLWSLGVLSCPLWVPVPCSLYPPGPSGDSIPGCAGPVPCSLYPPIPMVTASQAVQDQKDGERAEQSSRGDVGEPWGCSQECSHCPSSWQVSVPPVSSPAQVPGPGGNLLPAALVPCRRSRQGHRVSTHAGHWRGWGMELMGGVGSPSGCRRHGGGRGSAGGCLSLP